MAKIVALLDSMWGWGGYNDAGEEAPSYFKINPDNHSGRRLYRLCGNHSLLVTNSCRIVQRSANHHGSIDPEWVRGNLAFLNSEGMNLLLVCGRIARYTFETISGVPALTIPTNGISLVGGVGFVKYYAIDHPAARRWSREKIDSTARKIETLCQE